MKRTLLYLSMIAGSPSHERKLAGVRRYCSMRGWEAVPVPREQVSPKSLPGILRRYRPIGCVADGVACGTFLRPSLFRGIPVSFIAYPWTIAGKFPNFHFDSSLVAAAAFRELSSGNPPCFAAVGHPLFWDWSRFRVRWFRETAVASGAECLVFPGRPISSLQLDFEREGFIAARALAEGHSRSEAENRDRLGPLMVVRRKSTSGRGRHEPWILQAVDIIRREACDGLTVEKLISRFPQSRRNFERRFREATGHGIHDEILHARLEKACALLAHTDTAIGAIADFCGFRSYWALEDLFRSRFKMGMREWRRRNSC